MDICFVCGKLFCFLTDSELFAQCFKVSVEERTGRAEVPTLYLGSNLETATVFYEEDKTSYFQQDVPGTPFQFAHIFSKHFVLEIGMNLEFKLQVYCQSLLELKVAQVCKFNTQDLGTFKLKLSASTKSKSHTLSSIKTSLHKIL